MQEEWRDIPGYEGYYKVNGNGQVYSTRNQKVLKAHPVGDGRLVVTLMIDCNRKNYKVHQLIMLAFVGERPSGYQVHHRNGNFLDNRLENLEYISTSEHSALHSAICKAKYIPKEKVKSPKTPKKIETVKKPRKPKEPKRIYWL